MTKKLIQSQREAILSSLPSTSGKLSRKLKISQQTVRYRLRILEKENTVQIIGETSGEMGSPAQIFGLYTGVPYVKPSPPPLAETKYKTSWVGGCPYFAKQAA